MHGAAAEQELGVRGTGACDPFSPPQAVKHLIGDHYLQDKTWFPLALWNSIHRCHYVPDHGLVVKYEADPRWKGPKGLR